MPTRSEKRKILDALQPLVALEALESDGPDELMELLAKGKGEAFKALFLDGPMKLPTLAELYACLESRHLLAQGEPVPKSKSYLSLLARVDDARFRQDVRLSRRTFDYVLGRITGSPIFANPTNRQQAPVSEQLHLALHRFGCNGNGTSVGKVARLFGVSEGTAVKYTDRVVAALLAIREQHVYWYRDDSERQRVKQRIEEKSGLPHCLGALDGTDIVLAVRPELDGSTYFNCKGRYALNAQIVVDDTCRIRHYFLGFPGSVHDARAYSASGLARQPERFFRGQEYVLADSAYALTPTVISSYKGKAARKAENAQFNRVHSMVRIAVEHAIGQLKGRFGSLRGLRVRIRNKESFDRALDWSVACFVLHNMLLDIHEDEWSEDEHDEDSDTETDGEDNALSPRAVASRKREFLKSCVVDINTDA